MAIKLLVDSSSDIDREEAHSLGIHMISMSIQFGEAGYLDGVDLTKREFFEKLIESDELPKTSQINSFQFGEQFTSLTEDGSELLVITLSSRLSGTYLSAVQAAEDFPGKVFVVDSRNASIGERILVQYAIRLIKEGLSMEALVKNLEEAKQNIRLMALLGTLEYLQKGGRISAVTAADRKSTRLNSSHYATRKISRMPSSA